MTEPFDEAIEILTDVVYQSCGKRDCPHSDWYLDSMALSAYADAIRFLARQGKVEITSDHGRRVIATMNDQTKGDVKTPCNKQEVGKNNI